MTTLKLKLKKHIQLHEVVGALAGMFILLTLLSVFCDIVGTFFPWMHTAGAFFDTN